jgi:hypothetical protein
MTTRFLLQNKRTILRKCSGLVAEKILYTTKFLGECARPYDCIRYFIVGHDLLCVDRLSHVKINSKTALHR